MAVKYVQTLNKDVRNVTAEQELSYLLVFIEVVHSLSWCLLNGTRQTVFVYYCLAFQRYSLILRGLS